MDGVPSSYLGKIGRDRLFQDYSSWIRHGRSGLFFLCNCELNRCVYYRDSVPIVVVLVVVMTPRHTTNHRSHSWGHTTIFVN